MCIERCGVGALAALAILSSHAAMAQPAVETSERTSRNEILTLPAPYPPNRVDSPARLENGRLWRSTYPIGPDKIRPPSLNEPGPESVGAPRALDDLVIFVDQAHVPIAISPWETYPDLGFERYRRARNLWLREQGWVLNVRTHVNARYLHEARARAEAAPAPRATIRVHPKTERPSTIEAALPRSGEPITRISRPLRRTGRPLFVVQPLERPGSDVAEAGERDGE